MTLAEFVRSQRQKLDLSQGKFAEKIKLTPLAISLIERGISLYITTQTLQKLAGEFGCNLELLKSMVPKRPPGGRIREPETVRGRMVRFRRIELGLTQEQLAKLIGVKKQAVSYIETGEVRLTNNSGTTIIKLSKALQLKPDQLKAAESRRLKQKVNKGTVGGYFAERRIAKNMTLKELAAKVGIHKRTLCSFENDKFSASPTFLNRLSLALDCHFPNTQ